MYLSLNLFIISLLTQITGSQLNSETYPDPRIDPFRCKILTIGPACDPSELLTFNEKETLIKRIKQVHFIPLQILVDLRSASNGYSRFAALE